jgi:large subunit ribosomal protein L22
MKHSYMPVSLIRKTAAKAMGKNLPISPKVAIEISSFLRGMELAKAIATLKRVQTMDQAIPYKRFGHNVGHRPGMAAGRYPIKASTEILALLENAKINASNQGLSGRLVITHMAAQRASEPYRNRAKERITFKRAHVEVIVTEVAAPEKKTKSRAAPAAKDADKTVAEKAPKVSA